MVCHAWELFQQLAAMLFVSYCVACLWWWYSLAIHKILNQDPSFVYDFKLKNDSPISQVIITWYFIFSSMTTIGYGDYTATNTYEMGFSILILITCPSWFAYTTGKAISIIHKLRVVGGETDNAGDLAIWLSNIESKHKRLPYKLKEKINKHYINYWKNDRLGSMLNIAKETDAASEIIKIQDPYLDSLPDKLKKKVLHYLFDDIFNNFFFFLGEEHFEDIL